MRPPRGGQPPSLPRARPLPGEQTELRLSPSLTARSLPPASARRLEAPLRCAKAGFGAAPGVADWQSADPEVSLARSLSLGALGRIRGWLARPLLPPSCFPLSRCGKN